MRTYQPSRDINLVPHIYKLFHLSFHIKKKEHQLNIYYITAKLRNVKLKDYVYPANLHNNRDQISENHVNNKTSKHDKA